MDEPCSPGPEATLKVEDLMRKMAEKYTIVVVTHNMEQPPGIRQAAFLMMARTAPESWWSGANRPALHQSAGQAD